jgi:hypothetical protein
MMERRKLLKSLVSLPVIYAGEKVGVSYEVDPTKKHIVFLNPYLVDIEDFCSNPGTSQALGAGTPVHVVYANADLDQAVRIYEIDGGVSSRHTI